MTVPQRVLAEVAIQMALAPVAVVLWRRPRERMVWLIAAAFAVSWVADRVSILMAPPDRWVISIVYPVSQSALVGMAFLVRIRDQALFLFLLVVCGVVTVEWHGVTGPDLLLRSVAWCAIVALAWQEPEVRVSPAVLVYFGGGLLAWYAYVVWPGWTTWGSYQCVRLVGLGWFCRSTLVSKPSLRVLSRAA